MLTSEFAHQAYCEKTFNNHQVISWLQYKAAEVIITVPIIAQNVTEVLPDSLTLS